EPGDGEESDRGRERGDQQKSDDKRSEEERERPGQRRGDAPHSERPGEAPARREQERNRERESEVQLQSVHRRVSRRWTWGSVEETERFPKFSRTKGKHGGNMVYPVNASRKRTPVSFR